jgi:predicted RND superfamily exporter protein
VLAIGLSLAVLGWVLDTQTHVVSDIQRLVPQNLPELRNVKALERETGVSGEIDVTVSGADLTDPAVVSWMTSYQQGVLNQFKYHDGDLCRSSTICPALSLPELFNSGTGAPDATTIRARLASVPPYFSQAVITPDRREANLAFGIKQMPLDDQQKVIDVMRKRLDPPAGVRARLAGLPVLASEANDKLASPARRLLTLLAGLLAVGLALFAVFRRAERAAVPLVPIALATGWSSLLLFVMRVPLNPLSATLGALVIAISTEFSVLLCERYRQEREAGHEEQLALQRTYRSTGAAVLASGVTAIIGFGVLGISDIAMLRNFGLVTAVDLTVSLLGVLFVLPAVLQLSERGELLTVPRKVWRAISDRIPAGRGRSPAGMT